MYRRGLPLVELLLPLCRDSHLDTTSALRARRAIRRAFSLMELIIVIIIIGFLAGIAVPRFAGSVVRQRSGAAARRIAADFKLARESAISRSATQTVTFTANGYSLDGMADFDRSTSAYEIDLTEEPYHAKIFSADFGGDAEVVFDIFGIPDSGGTVVVEVGGYQKSIVLDADTGRASVQ